MSLIRGPYMESLNACSTHELHSYKEMDLNLERGKKRLARSVKGQLGSVTYSFYNEYIFLSFLKEFLSELDATSQLIYFHDISSINTKITSSVTSLKEHSIVHIKNNLKRRLGKELLLCDTSQVYELVIKDIPLFHDLLLQRLSDGELSEKYETDLAIIKTLKVHIKNQ